jgi:hypothetical protein
MIQPSIKQQILEDLDRLSPELQRRAQELVHELALSTTRPKGTPGRELLRFAGILDDESAAEMERVIEEGCERIDPDGW